MAGDRHTICSTLNSHPGWGGAGLRCNNERYIIVFSFNQIHFCFIEDLAARHLIEAVQLEPGVLLHVGAGVDGEQVGEVLVLVLAQVDSLAPAAHGGHTVYWIFQHPSAENQKFLLSKVQISRHRH